MRRWAGGLLLLLCACGSGPYGSFDAGHDVHVILLPRPAPRKGLEVRPVCTLGALVAESPPRLLKAGGAPAAEVAVFRAPAGRHRLAIWEPRTRSAAETDLEVDRELWVVMEIRPRERKGKLTVYDRPPAEEAGAYAPFVPVPD